MCTVITAAINTHGASLAISGIQCKRDKKVPFTYIHFQELTIVLLLLSSADIQRVVTITPITTNIRMIF